jgi:hypothetical protein
MFCVRGYDGATAIFDETCPRLGIAARAPGITARARNPKSIRPNVTTPGSIGQPTRTATRTRRRHRHCCCPLHR